jgi:hypothetical protein
VWLARLIGRTAPLVLLRVRFPNQLGPSFAMPLDLNLD